MKNPLRSEAEAFQFLIGAIVYFAAIAIAGGVGGRWWGIGVFVLASAIVLWWWIRARRAEAAPTASRLRETPSDVHRVLVVANETVGGRALHERIRQAVEGLNAEIFVITPALNSPLRHWLSDEDGARAAAQRRLDASLASLSAEGVEASGVVGDSEPLMAMEDALRTFGADEIIISTHPPGRSHWLEQGLVEAARARFPLPVTHVVTDLEAEQARMSSAQASESARADSDARENP
jgi:hypothetical protein